MQLFQRVHHFAPESLDVVRRHQRNRADMKCSGAGADNFKPCVVRIGLRGERQWKCLVILPIFPIETVWRSGAFVPQSD